MATASMPPDRQQFEGDKRPEVDGGREPKFVQIPLWVLHNDALSPSAKLTYGRLKLFAGTNGQCFPKHDTLAREVCLSPRRLRDVLTELRGAGLIDWTRRRSSCAFTFPDRQNTASLSGGKLPTRPEENRHSSSAEKCLQKIGIENHHQKRGIEKKTAPLPKRRKSLALPENHPPTLSEAIGVDDDESHMRIATLRPRERLSNARAEFIARLKERHGDGYDAENTAKLVSVDLGEKNLLLSDDFLDFDATTTTNPSALHNPVGHYRRLVKKFLNEHTRVLIAEQMAQRAPLTVEQSTSGRCEQCQGGGRISYPDGDYCACNMGADLRKAEARHQTECQETASATVTEAA